MPIKENQTSQYDEHSRKGALAQNTINAFKVMAHAPKDFYTAIELINMAGIKDERNVESKAYKSRQSFETWFISKLKVLAALGKYGVEYTDKKGIKHKPRPKYLDIRSIDTAKGKIPVFRLTPLGIAKLKDIVEGKTTTINAEDDDADEDGA